MSCSIVLLHSISCNLQHQIALQWQHCSVLWLIKSNILVYLPFAPSDGNPVGAAVSTVNTHIHPSNRVFPLKEKGPSSVILHLLNPFDFEHLPKYVKLDPKCCKNKKNLWSSWGMKMVWWHSVNYFHSQPVELSHKNSSGQEGALQRLASLCDTSLQQNCGTKANF